MCPKGKALKFRYKVVETQTVTDDVLEGLINRWVAQGWELDGIRFAMSDASKRPAMAFVLFVREEEGEEEADDRQP